ncbi:MAG: hypothetical protein IJL12_08035 [Selenomonadaceae bacterium]|nr:hypothetical protein [Selenomonadaceae bacterium]
MPSTTKVTVVKVSFDKTLKTTLIFKAAGVNTFIKCVAMKQNYELGRRLNIYVTISPRIITGHDGKCAADYSLGRLEHTNRRKILANKFLAGEFEAKAYLWGQARRLKATFVSPNKFWIRAKIFLIAERL